MIDLSELSSNQEANLLTTGLEEWQEESQVLTYGAILICRRGKATLHINYKDWELHEGAVITVFPNDVVELTVWKEDGTPVSPEVPLFSGRDAQIQSVFIERGEFTVGANGIFSFA